MQERPAHPRGLDPRLLADIGGTNARFALEVAPGQMDAIEVLACADYPTLAAALVAYLALPPVVEVIAKSGATHIRHGAIAIANPVIGDFVRMTNHHWSFSTRALQSEPDTIAYAATKGGLVALTHALAVSLGPEIRVNCISPGWIATAEYLPRDKRHPPELSKQDHAQHPAGRVGTPEDIAGLCAYLLSDEAGFVTAANFTVDGGMTHKMIYV